MKKAIIIIALLFFFYGCCEPLINEDVFQFTKSELEFLRPFSMNDTISFENDTLEEESILIRKFGGESYNDCSNFLQRAPFNGRYIEINHLPIDNWTGTNYLKGGQKETTYQTFFSMSKDFELNSMGFSVSFKGFHSKAIKIAIDSTQTIKIKGRVIEKCYQLEHDYPERIEHPKDIVRVYWTKREGLVAYENKAGDIWMKK